MDVRSYRGAEFQVIMKIAQEQPNMQKMKNGNIKRYVINCLKDEKITEQLENYISFKLRRETEAEDVEDM